jgi:hypothetical protein|tara:strand:+ start:11574 stop:11774 length:201 start_codon:yes stop_codon:yes gene_type:complete
VHSPIIRGSKAELAIRASSPAPDGFKVGHDGAREIITNRDGLNRISAEVNETQGGHFTRRCTEPLK